MAIQHLSATILALALAASPAWAGDTEDDDLDALLNDDFGGTSTDPAAAPSTVAGELRALREEEAAPVVPAIVLPEEQDERRVIKTLQQKTFLKLGRFEASPFLGFVTNDPFIKRNILGAGLNYHPTEIFSFEGTVAFSPDMGEADYRPITKQLIANNGVSPDISKILFFGSAAFQFSPIYGKLAVVGGHIINFDLYGSFGLGVVHTVEDLEALGTDTSTDAQATASQNHATINFGGGLRVIFTPSVAARLDVRSMVYNETVNSNTLEYKNPLLLTGGVSFFFPQVE